MKYSRQDFALISLVLAVILAIAAGIRFYNLGSQSLWSDEGNSAALVTRSFAQIALDAGRDIHPPLYYWILKAWTGTFGRGEIPLRSLSALLGTLLVLAVAELARRLYGEPAGLAAGFVSALAPFQLYYSQEARMYMLLATESALAMLLLWSFIQQEHRLLDPPGSDKRRLSGERRAHRLALLPPLGLGLVALLAAGLYTHYAFPLMLGLMNVLYLAWLWASRRRGEVLRRIIRWTLLLALTLAIFAPWLPTAYRQLTVWPTGGATVNPWQALQTTLATLGLGPTGLDRAGQAPMWILTALALLGLFPWRLAIGRSTRPERAAAGDAASLPPTADGPAAGLAAGAPAVAQPAPLGSPARDRQGARPCSAALCERFQPIWLGWLIPALWVVAPLAMMLVLGLFRDAYLKFLLVASPAYSLLLARAIVLPASALNLPAPRPASPLHARPGSLPLQGVFAAAWVVGALALVGALSGGTIVRYFSDPAVARDDYRGIAQFITATAQANDAILLDAPGQSEVFNYYYRGNLPIYALPAKRPADPADVLKQLAQLLQHDKVYAIYWASAEADPDHLIDNWMNSRGYKTLDQWRGNVRLAVYVMPERRAADETADGLNLTLGSDIILRGYRGWNLAPVAGEVTQIQLLWQANKTPARRYKIFLQLLDAHDQVIAQQDAEPVGESRPTDGWAPGELIIDNHGLLIGPGTPPGTYRRILGMYDPQTGERLRLPDGKDNISLPPITVTRNNKPPTLAALDMQYTQTFDFGAITLLGHDSYKRGFRHAPDTPLHPGDQLHVTFYWQANSLPRADWWFSLALNDSAGHTVAAVQHPLVSDSYSTMLWQKGEVVRGEHDLMIPDNLPPDTYRLSLTLLPDTDTQAGVAYLGTVTVTRPEK